MKRILRIIVVSVCMVMVVLCFSIQGQAKVNSKAKKLTKEFTNYAAYIAMYKNGGTKNFSSGVKRKEACQYNLAYENGQSFQKVSKRLFGKKSPYGKAFMGEWGADSPYLTNFKMIKQGGGRYVIKARLMSETDMGYDERWGDVKLYVKKSKKSPYGYVATRLWVKANM